MSPQSYANCNTEDGESFVSSLVQACPNIEQLEIVFPSFIDLSLANADMFFGSKRLQFLRHLHLYHFSLPAQGLANMLYRHRKTLKCLELEGMILSIGRWTSIFKFLHDHIKLDDFGGHNLYESGLRHYHRPEGDLEKYILGEIKDIDWVEIEKDYLAVDDIDEGVLMLANTFGPSAHIHIGLIDELYDISSDTMPPEPVELEIVNDEKALESDTDNEYWSPDDDGELSDDSDDLGGQGE
jgi:hypothetical protein